MYHSLNSLKGVRWGIEALLTAGSIHLKPLNPAASEAFTPASKFTFVAGTQTTSHGIGVLGL